MRYFCHGYYPDMLMKEQAEYRACPGRKWWTALLYEQNKQQQEGNKLLLNYRTTPHCSILMYDSNVGHVFEKED
jgi:hypothetical protein